MLFLIPLIFSLVSPALAAKDCQTDYGPMGIPHVEVSSEQEFYYCFGLHHGKDRAWEMDYFRRSAQGRNAEVLGFGQLKSDLMMRLLDLPSLANKLWSAFPPDKKQILQWYSQGVNEGFKEGKSSPEFVDQGYEPGEWKGEHSLMVLLLQSFDQTRRTFWMDYMHESYKEKWGERAEKLFDEELTPWFDTIMKPGEYPVNPQYSGFKDATTFNRGRIWQNFPAIFGEESGSNNWAISKSKSKTGHAIFANDPHLDLVTPLFWYWIHLKAPTQEVIGASLPGVPVIASGTNGKVAWGLTNAYINTADAVFVKDIPEEEITSIRPLVWVKLGFLKLPFFFKSFEKTKSGHRILPLELENEAPLLLRWTGFSLSPADVYSMFELPEVDNVKEMDELLKRVGLPAWNFAFADTKGEIGFRVIGRIYQHPAPTEFGVPVMKYAELKNEKFLLPEERPSVLNPEKDYVYSANHRHWPSDSKFHGGRGYTLPFRGFRINELLGTSGKLDIDDIKNFQCDDQVVDARFFVPRLLVHVQDPLLKRWDFEAAADSQALPLYRRWMDLLMENWEVNETALWNLLGSLDVKQREDLQKYYQQAKEEVSARTWGDFHRLAFPHLSKNNLWIFSPEVAGVGDNHTVNPGTSRWNENRKLYEQYSGASMRMIVEMKEKPVIQLSLPGLNREYTLKSRNSPWEEWRNCRYAEISY